MLHSLAKNWWALAFRGLAAVLFGLLTFLLPGITLATLVLLFGAYALVDGIFNVIAFFKVASHYWALPNLLNLEMHPESDLYFPQGASKCRRADGFYFRFT